MAAFTKKLEQLWPLRTCTEQEMRALSSEVQMAHSHRGENVRMLAQNIDKMHDYLLGYCDIHPVENPYILNGRKQKSCQLRE